MTISRNPSRAAVIATAVTANSFRKERKYWSQEKYKFKFKYSSKRKYGSKY